MTDDLVQWLVEQFNEDERIARQAGNRRWLVQDNTIELYPEREDDGFMSWPTRADARHAANWDPARVLREIDAKRQWFDEHQDVNDGSCGTCVDGQWGYPTHGGSSPQRFPCRTLRLLALPYADRPGYREEWRP
ncbi:DUF6221 family protein [Streptomyces sp. NPDC007920]|uniref:DUF6221 family protein n=1 Tax=Streptomyces sp. NPDC007920 TaxID=3364794 RepID=UPI0036E34621